MMDPLTGGPPCPDTCCPPDPTAPATSTSSAAGTGPLQTFFLQVSRPDATGDDDRILVWMGTDWRAHDDLGPVLAAAASWAIVPPDLAEQLAAERDADRRARPPAVLTALIVGRS